MADNAATPETTQNDPDPGSDPGHDPAFDGEKEEWRQYVRQHEKNAKAALADLKKERKEREALQAKLEEFAAANQSETEKAIEKARKEAAEAAKAEVTSEFRARVLRSEIRAQAAGKFADPDDAIRLLDLDDGDVFDDDGEVQTDALTKELDALLERKPHLKADSNGRPAGDADAGKGVDFGSSGTPEQQHNEWLAGILQRG